MLLADEVFCVAHDDRTGKARLSARVLGLGLAAGLLGELVLFDRLAVRDGGVYVTDSEPPPDALAHTILALLEAHPQYRDLRTWLTFLAETAAESVAQRLVLAGVWRRVEQRRLGRTRASHLPTDANAVAWRSVRLARLLIGGEPVNEPDAMLAGLVEVTGLTDVVLWQPETCDVGQDRLAAVVADLDPPLHHLLTFAEAAIGDAVLAPH